MVNYKIFSERLKQLREDMGLNQRTFAEFVGCTQNTLSTYENNPRNPSFEIIHDIAVACNVSIDWLCGISDVQTTGNAIETYSDLFRILFKVEAGCPKTLRIGQSDVMAQNDEAQDADDISCDALVFSEVEMKEFLSEWIKMKKLHDRHTIDDDVYDLWKEKIIMKKYSVRPDGTKEKPKRHELLETCYKLSNMLERDG